MRVLKKFKQNFNSYYEVLLFLQIFSLITVLPFLIKVLTLPRLMNTLTPRVKTLDDRHNRRELEVRIIKYTDYILSRNFWVYKITCLKRSLILYHFLRKAGCCVQICFGVRRKAGSADSSGEKAIEGHAWLLYNGNIYLERNSEIAKKYAVAYRFPEKCDKKGSCERELRTFLS
jgi:hypothetical protein